MVSKDSEQQAPEKEAAPWLEIIRNQGSACLFGKFDPYWFGKRSSPIPKEKYRTVAQDCSDQAGFGIVGKIEGSSHFLSQNQIIFKLGQNEPPRGPNRYYLINADLPDNIYARTRLQIPDGTTLTTFCYFMWSHQDSIPDNRGHHCPLTFNFLLPQEFKQDFINTITQSPNLIEDIFRRAYPSLIGPDRIQRIQTDTLELRGCSTVASESSNVEFSHPVGERSL